MHELSLSTAIVNTVCKHAAGRRVTVVSLRIGRLRQVVVPTLEFYWEIVGRDSVCEGARLEVEAVPAVLRCASCTHSWEIEVPAFVCPRCGPDDVSVLTGEEFEVESIICVEREEEPCIAPR